MNFAMRIEVDSDALVLTMPKVIDDCVIPWQDAWELGATLEEAAKQLPMELLIGEKIRAGMDQVRVTTYGGLVVLLFKHTDRVRLTRNAAIFLGQQIRAKAQELKHAKQLGGKKLPGSR
jgi:hypothetical protein